MGNNTDLSEYVKKLKKYQSVLIYSMLKFYKYSVIVITDVVS